MGLTRLFPGVGAGGLGQTLIHRLGDAGGPVAGRVSQELDSIIAWAKLSPRIIHMDVSTVGNVGGGLDTLHTFSLPANSLATNNDWVRVRYGGRYANTEADKQIRTSIDGQVSISFGAVIDLENGAWFVDAYYVRLSATTVRFAGMDMHVAFRMADGAIVTSPSGAFHVPRNVTPLTVSDLNANAVTLLVQGEGTANDDVFQNLSIIELWQQ